MLQAGLVCLHVLANIARIVTVANVTTSEHLQASPSVHLTAREGNKAKQIYMGFRTL